MKESASRSDGESAPQGEARLSGTKLQIAEAALDTLKANGFAGSSARAIAHRGGFNQALIFYHFGSVQNALLPAPHLITQRPLPASPPPSADPPTPSNLG